MQLLLLYWHWSKSSTTAILHHLTLFLAFLLSHIIQKTKPLSKKLILKSSFHPHGNDIDRSDVILAGLNLWDHWSKGKTFKTVLKKKGPRAFSTFILLLKRDTVRSLGVWRHFYQSCTELQAGYTKHPLLITCPPEHHWSWQIYIQLSFHQYLSVINYWSLWKASASCLKCHHPYIDA